MKKPIGNKLMLMAVVSFGVMFAFMYMMVDRYSNVYINLNQFYMVAVMVAAMMIVEIAIMASMYERKVKIITTIVSIVALVLFFSFVRNQTALSDKEFLKSMIVHHGSALLMCENAKLKDSEVKALCDEIISGQQTQIDWMKNKVSNFK